MPDAYVLGSAERVEEFEIEEDPADSFVVLHCGPVDIEARAQLYALILGMFSDDAVSLEMLHRKVTDDGPFFYEIEQTLIDALANLDEAAIEAVALNWCESEAMESLELADSDIVEFLFNLANLCQTTNDELGLYILGAD